MPEIPEGFGLYDVKDAKNNPLMLTHEHAAEIKAKPHGEPAEEPKAPAKPPKD